MMRAVLIAAGLFLSSCSSTKGLVRVEYVDGSEASTSFACVRKAEGQFSCVDLERFMLYALQEVGLPQTGSNREL